MAFQTRWIPFIFRQLLWQTCIAGWWHNGVQWSRWCRIQHQELGVTESHPFFVCFDYLRTYLLTPWSRVIIEKLTGSQVVKKFPAFYGTRRFITAFTRATHLSLFSDSLIQSTPPHPTSWRSILILPSNLGQGHTSGLISSGFPTKKPVYTSTLPIRATCSAHFILLDLITRIILGEEYRSLSSSLRSFLHSPVTSSILRPNILINILSSITLSLRSYLKVSDQVSHPYKTDKIINLFTLTLKIWIENWKTKDSAPNGSKPW